jgi:polysaccharide deacetylase family protein (PEP-CTERM system associated)
VARPVSFTLDVEHHAPSGAHDPRLRAATEAVLDLFDTIGARATVFVVGDVATHVPDLVRSIADRGHEIGLHGWTHTPLTDLDPVSFASDVARGRELLSELSGQRIVGFRAPTFSLTLRAVWAADVLADAGFTYSSSVLPAHNPLHGFPGAPTEPFHWRCGLLEFPSPVAGLGPARIPYLGGTYVRLLPRSVLAVLRRSGLDGPAPWVYVHPYDLDVDEPFWREPVAGPLARLLWVGRRGLPAKLADLAVNGVAPPLGERVESFAEAPVFVAPVALVGARGHAR